MTKSTSERSVAECAEKIVSQIVIDDIQKSDLRWLIKTALIIERQKREDAVEAERERIISLIDSGHHDPTTDSGWSVSLEDIKETIEVNGKTYKKADVETRRCLQLCSTKCRKSHQSTTR